MVTRRWWHVEFDDVGTIVSCVPTSASALAAFVFAESEEAARKLAKNKIANILRVRRRETRKSAGLCFQCCVRTDGGYYLCPKCRENRRGVQQRIRDRARGLDVPKRAVGGGHHAPEQLALGVAGAARLSVLKEVREAWVRFETIDSFARWLAEEIRVLDSAARPQLANEVSRAAE